MIRRKAVIGVALVCALAFSVLGAQSASAAGGTTAFTCVKGAPSNDFEDAHCDKGKVGGGFGHVEIAAGTATETTTSNVLTGTERNSAILKGKIAGVEIEITCGTVQGTGSITNVAGPPMKVTGKGEVRFTECKLLKPAAQAAKCTVTVAPISDVGETTGMSGKILPASGSTFTELTIAGVECAAGLKGTFPISGSVTGTGVGGEAEGPKWSGATAHITDAMSTSTLTFAGNPAGLELTTTAVMKEGNPIVLTTE